MRQLSIALMLMLSLTACVSTRQFADPQFLPPQGDYSLLVMRPDVSVGSVSAGGVVEPRADWTETARGHVIDALRAQQAERGGEVRIVATRDDLPGVSPEEVASLERLHSAVGNSIALHHYYGYRLPNKRGQGLDYTLGEGALELGRKTGHDYALFLHAEDRIVGSGRAALQVLGVAGCFIGFCAPTMGGGGQLAYASLVDLRTGEVVWFNILTTGSQVAGVKFGDIRTREGADQMVERLLGRMKPGKAMRKAGQGESR
ncbi:hypothetical protein [Sphingomicrobium lutaoense]|uniref:Lipoprotein n=1 Tax=Sphingomicrobium lutaoense TaxID=515949 RepID=A0A839YYK7_9SPHN|nr:hypothetical protein [Sphingomicrobium lutaoense]MBB3763560.1 hypothetical protein [Sphingomicrobium lutaoense]